ncbi:relaxase/mobilization nuclease domain-containing protein [Brachybacterium sp. UNK5269]|uniref:relaxase/mobilization nuclease domain-containing protein n=1 Tax=Brachybacterium sp. UNK5269 TaxID=3408576 RepID=UPI003BB1D76E
MAEQIAAVVVASPTRNSARLSTYVSAPKKGQKGERFVAASGINGCIPEVAEKQMRDNRKRWGKNGERVVELPNGGKAVEGEYVQAYHVIQSLARDGVGSLDPENPEDWEKAHGLGVDLAREVAGKNRLATVHTQIDGTTGCIHNHIVIDSIDKSTGRSFDSSRVKHAELVKVHDRMLAGLGYEQVNRYAPPGVAKGAEKTEKSELRTLAKHELWEASGREGEEPFSVAVLKRRIRRTLEEETFTDFESFVDAAREQGVDVQQRGQSGRGVTYAMLRRGAGDEEWREISPSDLRRSSKLGRDFELGAIEKAAERNADLVARREQFDAQLRDGIEASLADIRSVDEGSYRGVLEEKRIVLERESDEWSYGVMDESGPQARMRWRKASLLSNELTQEGAQEFFEINKGRSADHGRLGQDRSAGTGARDFGAVDVIERDQRDAGGADLDGRASRRVAEPDHRDGAGAEDLEGLNAKLSEHRRCAEHARRPHDDGRADRGNSDQQQGGKAPRRKLSEQVRARSARDDERSSRRDEGRGLGD